MTVIVHQNGVLYSDSRRSSRDGVTSDNVMKLIPVEVNEKMLWDGKPILGFAAAGRTNDIDKFVKVIQQGGEQAYKEMRNVSKLGMVKELDVMMGIVTATHYYVINIEPSRGVNRLPLPSKHPRDELVTFGSGRTAATLAGNWFKTDAVGRVCGAIALADDTCGGFVLTLDTNQRKPKIVSKYYRYPRVRMLLGSIYLKLRRAWQWYNRHFVY